MKENHESAVISMAEASIAVQTGWCYCCYSGVNVHL